MSIDKGIRSYCNHKFMEVLPTRTNTRQGNTVFRKTVMSDCMEQFSISLASASTHYNHSFIEAQKAVTAGTLDAKLLEGLGRAPDKKGGRKPKSKVVETVTDGAAILLLGYTPTPVAQPLDFTVNAETVVEVVVIAEETQAANEAIVLDAVQTAWKVCTKKDNAVVAEDLTFEAAKAMVDKAAKAKKAKLYFV